MVGRLKSRMRLKDWLLKDLNYKIISLFAALLLWMMVLGRKDLTVSKKLEVEFLSGPQTEVIEPSVRRVDIELTGPRVALKKFSQSGAIYMLDLSGLREGAHVVPLSKQGVQVPVGVRVLSVRPDHIRLQLKPLREDAG